MTLSLKKEKMVEFLEGHKAQGETFSCMLWGTVFADEAYFQNWGLVSRIMFSQNAAGISGSPNTAFCYIGLTEQSLYVVAVDTNDTSKITAVFTVPFADVSFLSIKKALMGSQIIDIGCAGFTEEAMRLTIKGTSVGTNIKDQKERMQAFITAMEALKSRLAL